MDGGTLLDTPPDTAIVDLDGEVNHVAGILNVHHGRLVDIAIELLRDDRRWSGAGMTSATHWLSWRCGLSSTTAAAVVTIAERAHDLPATVESLRRGELSLDQAASIARKAPWWCDEQARDYGRSMTVHQLRMVLGSYPYPDLDADGRERRTESGESSGDESSGAESSADDSPSPGSSSPSGDTASAGLPDEWCSLTVDDHGMVRLTAGLHPDTGAIVRHALDTARTDLFNGGHTDIDTTDALRHLAERSLDTHNDRRRRPRHTTALHIDITTGTATDTTGLRVPDSIRRHLTCDGALTPTFTRDARPVSVGRARYVVPQRTRTIIEHRDHGHCRIPGCTARISLEIHHIIHWEHGGPTDTWNLILICGKHHRLHHRGRLTITGNADQPNGIAFANQHRTPITPTGADPTPPTRPPPPPEPAYRHPDGGRLHKQWVHFEPPPAHIEQLHQRSTSDRDFLTQLAPPWTN